MRLSTGNRRPSFHIILAIIALLFAALYSVGLVVDWPDWIRGVNWVWVRRVPQPGWRAVWMALAIGGGLLLGRQALGDGDWSRRRTAVFLMALVALTPLLQVAVAAQHRAQPLSVAVMSAAGFWHEGVQIEDPLRFARQYPTIMPSFADVHLRTQPPGWPLAYRGLSRLYERFPGLADNVGRRIHRYDCAAPQLIGFDSSQLAAGSLRIGLLFLGGLGAPLLYAIGRRFYSARAARLSALAFAFLPAMLVFAGRFDGFFALLALLMMWLALKAILDGGRAAAASLAALIAAATFLSFTALALAGFTLLLVGACALASRRRDIIRRWLAVAALVGGAVVLFWGMLRLFLGIDGLAIWRVSQEMHRLLRLEYPIWPLFNLYDLAVFMGIVPFVGVVGASLVAFTDRRRGWRAPGTALALGWVAAVVLLNLSGTVRAETARLWLFLMPVGLLAGWAFFVERFAGKEGAGGRAGKRWLMLLLAGYLTQALVTGYFLGGRAPEPATPPPHFRLPPAFNELDYQLGQSIALRGYTLESTADGSRLTLFWQAADFPRAEYSVFVHALDGDGAIIAQSDGPPAVPIWCWVPGEVVADERLLAAPDQTRHFAAGIYDPLTGARLPVSPPVADDIIRLPAGD